MTTITRTAFNELSPRDRMQIVREHSHVIINDPPVPARVAGPGELARVAFDRMTDLEKRLTIKSGVQIVDAEEGPAAGPYDNPPPGFKTATVGFGYIKI